MSFTVENLEEKNMVKLVIESTAEEFEAGLNTAYNKNKSKISLPGFRKGKAPRKMIEKMYGAEGSTKMLLIQSFQMLMLRLLMSVVLSLFLSQRLM